MTQSSKRRHVRAYRAAMETVAAQHPEVAAEIEEYVLWLQNQITQKRKMVQVLRVEIDQLGGGYDEHEFRNKEIPG